jgi:hypothetical protein
MPKSIFIPHLGHHVHFGRVRSRSNTPHLKLARYAAALPPPPAAIDYTKPALAALKNVYLNDTYGDCVIAGGYHIEAVATGGAGALFTASPAQIIADYSAIGGYVPGNPATDQGCDLQTAMNYWVQKGFRNGTKLAGWLAVDPKNKVELQQALWLFENLYFGIELPDAWITPFPAADGFVWDNGPPDNQNGHCVAGVGYGAAGVTIDTWGMFGTMTWSAIGSLASAAEGGEVYVLLTPDMIAKATQKAPNGFDWATLASDFNALGGHVPIPVPPPPPPPPPPAPAPHPAPTLNLAQAQAVLAAGWPKH